MAEDEGLEDDVKKISTMPPQLGCFVLSKIKRIMNIFIGAIVSCKSNDSYYQDTDSMYIKKKHWDKLNAAGLTGKNLLQGKNV